MVGTANHQGLNTPYVVRPCVGSSRNLRFNRQLISEEPVKIRGMVVEVWEFNDGWYIDCVNSDYDPEFDRVGPFKTPEAAWLALQIIKD